MDSLFKRRMAQLGGSAGEAIKNKNNAVVNKLFAADAAYKKCFLYDCCFHPLQEVEAKFQVANSFSIWKDQVEYLLQFRPGFYPEKIYNTRGNREALGFYIEIPDNTGQLETWLIAGRNDRTQFVRYHIIKCNWVFRWTYEGALYSCLGVLRYKKTLSGGIQEGTFITEAENQNTIWLPDTDDTKTIHYDTRFLLSKTRPLVFSVSRIEDTFPAGIVRLQLKQTPFNPNTDSLKAGVADYFNNQKTPAQNKPLENPLSLSVSGKTNRLMIGGSSKMVTADLTKRADFLADEKIEWEFCLNGEKQEPEQMEPYFTLSFPSGNSVKIRAKRELAAFPALIGSILEITAYAEDRSYSDKVELEVVLS